MSTNRESSIKQNVVILRHEAEMLFNSVLKEHDEEDWRRRIRMSAEWLLDAADKYETCSSRMNADVFARAEALERCARRLMKQTFEIYQ